MAAQSVKAQQDSPQRAMNTAPGYALPTPSLPLSAAEVHLQDIYTTLAPYLYRITFAPAIHTLLHFYFQPNTQPLTLHITITPSTHHTINPAPHKTQLTRPSVAAQATSCTATHHHTKEKAAQTKTTHPSPAQQRNTRRTITQACVGFLLLTLYSTCS